MTLQYGTPKSLPAMKDDALQDAATWFQERAYENGRDARLTNLKAYQYLVTITTVRN